MSHPLLSLVASQTTTRPRHLATNHWTTHFHSLDRALPLPPSSLSSHRREAVAAVALDEARESAPTTEMFKWWLRKSRPSLHHLNCPLTVTLTWRGHHGVRPWRAMTLIRPSFILVTLRKSAHLNGTHPWTTSFERHRRMHSLHHAIYTMTYLITTLFCTFLILANTLTHTSQSHIL